MKAQTVHNQVRRIAVALMVVLVAFTAVHCAAVPGNAADASGPAHSAAAALNGRGGINGTQGIDAGIAHVGAASHCPSAELVVAADAGPRALLALASAVAPVPHHRWGASGLRAPPRPPGSLWTPVAGRALLHRFCVLRR